MVKSKGAGVLALLVAVCMTVACTMETQREVVQEIPADTPAEKYLEMLYRFNAAASEERTRLFLRAAADYESQPSPANSLRLGLFSAWPGHSGTNSDKAGQLIREALDHADDLPAGAVNLAWIYLAIVERQKSSAQRIQALESALFDAREKIKALTSIETTVEPATGANQDGDHEDDGN